MDGKRKKIYIVPLTAGLFLEKLNVIKNQVAQLINLGFNVFVPHNFIYRNSRWSITQEDGLASFGLDRKLIPLRYQSFSRNG